MKKSLLALAVLGAFAGAAQAQTGITIRGLIDLGYQNLDVDSALVGGAVADTQGIARNGSATSTLVFEGTEDLGGGLKAGFFLATDFVAGNTGSAFLNSQNYLSLGGGFGEVKLGNINSQIMAAATTAQPFGTAIGGGYSGTFSRLDGIDVSGNPGSTAPTIAGARVIRTGNSLYYTTPNFSGFTATAGISFENDETADSDTAGAREFAVSYKANGLNAVLAYYKTTTGAFPYVVGTGATATTILPANSDVEQVALGANYQFGPATIYAGYTASDAGGGARGLLDTVSYNIAGKYAVTPALAVMANFVRVNDKLAANEDRNLFGLGADYSLSKRTTAYVRYENGEADKSIANTDFSQYAIGVRHTF
ncbi:MAG TPA: porin [Noviherbaspirillum sp.]